MTKQSNEVIRVVYREDCKLSTVHKKSLIVKIVLFAPIVMLFIGLLGYFVILPIIYGKILPFSWFFIEPENVVDVLYNQNAILLKDHSLIGLQILGRVWLAGFIASLFFLGRQLHMKPDPDVTNAILVKKEPYLLVQEIRDILKQVKQQRSSKELDALVSTVKHLEEKLSVESDFGYGESPVINCENNITKQLQFLKETALNIEAGDFNKNLRTLSSTVTNVNSLLRQRIELKKH